MAPWFGAFFIFQNPKKNMTSASRQKKEIKVAEIAQKLEDSTAVVLVNYTGLTVKKQQELKKMLQAVSASMFVAKNNLMQIASTKANLPSEAFTDEILSGPTAIVVTQKDPIATLQALSKFAKENEIPQFKVGIIEGSLYDKNSLIKLASLPSKEILFGQVIGTIASPVYGLVNTMQANIQKLLYILQTASKK